MSLLMQALRQAEHSKQQNDRSSEKAADEEQASPDTPDSLTLEPIDPSFLSGGNNESPPLAVDEKKPLPSLALPVAEPENVPVAEQPAPAAMPALEALAFDTVPAAPAMPPAVAAPDKIADTKIDVPPPTPASPVSQQAAPSRPPSPPSSPTESRPSPLRQTAKSVFAAKQPKGGKRVYRLALAGMALVLAGGAAFGYYYVLSIGQNSGVLPANPAPPVAQSPVVAQPAAAQATPAQASAAAPASAAAALPPLARITVPALEAVPPKAEPDAKKTAAQAAESSAGSEKLATKSPQAMDAPGILIKQGHQENQTNALLSDAYRALMAGDTNTAYRQYQEVLHRDAVNRDALLGLASIALVRKQPAFAGSYYARLLELDPADADAIAGLTSLHTGNPDESESRLKKVLALNPQAGPALFELGNLYARQSRWTEAQQSYFQAYGVAPGNADYAFNLAVSLDRLSQSKLALEYYQRALSLAQTAPGNFNKNAVQSRIKELQTAAAN